MSLFREASLKRKIAKLQEELSSLQHHKSMSLTEQEWFAKYLESLHKKGGDAKRFAVLVKQVLAKAVMDANQLEQLETDHHDTLDDIMGPAGQG